jgi:hypothetical protein
MLAGVARSAAGIPAPGPAGFPPADRARSPGKRPPADRASPGSDTHGHAAPDLLNFQLRLRPLGRPIAQSVDDSTETRMTGNDYRNLKICEWRDELKKLDDIARSTYSPVTKRRLLGASRRRIHDLTALLLSPALAGICS